MKQNSKPNTTLLWLCLDLFREIKNTKKNEVQSSLHPQTSRGSALLSSALGTAALATRGEADSKCEDGQNTCQEPKEMTLSSTHLPSTKEQKLSIRSLITAVT